MERRRVEFLSRGHPGPAERERREKHIYDTLVEAAVVIGRRDSNSRS